MNRGLPPLLPATLFLLFGAWSTSCSQAPPTSDAGSWTAIELSDSDALEQFVFSDPAAWRHHDDPERPALELHASSDYRPSHRSPHSLALLQDRQFGDFVLEGQLMQTGREYGHRDLCLIFGYQGPDRYYYVHLASQPDDRAHNIFLVDGAARRRIAEVASKGVDWGTGLWHKVRLERDLDDGAIRVYFDDLSHPVLSTTDRTIDWGHLGFGSFDDTGRFAALRVWSSETRKARLAAFPAPAVSE